MRWWAIGLMMMMGVGPAGLVAGCQPPKTGETPAEPAPDDPAASDHHEGGASPEPSSKDPVDALIEAALSPPGEGSDVPSMDFSDAPDDQAPGIGTDGSPTGPSGGEVEWLRAGTVEIPNPGWRKTEGAELGLLVSPDEKAVILFTGFDTPEDGLHKVDSIIAAMKMTDVRWQKPKPVRIGPDHLTAAIGAGHGKSEGGKGATLFYALMKTGGAKNLLAIGGADDDAPKGSLRACLDIIDHVRRAR